MAPRSPVHAQGSGLTPPLNTAEIVAAYGDGGSLLALSRRYGCTTKTIRRRLLLAGVTIRMGGRAHHGLLPGVRRDFGQKVQHTKGRVDPMASKPATKAKMAAAPKAAAKKPGKPVAAAKAPAAAPSAAKTQPVAKGAPKKVAETITLKTVFEQLAAEHDLPKKQAQSLLSGFVAGVTKILQNGDRLRMSGLGVIEVKDRPARMGRNPATGAAVQIAASKKVAFRAAKELKAAV